MVLYCKITKYIVTLLHIADKHDTSVYFDYRRIYTNNMPLYVEMTGFCAFYIHQQLQIYGVNSVVISFTKNKKKMLINLYITHLDFIKEGGSGYSPMHIYGTSATLVICADNFSWHCLIDCVFVNEKYAIESCSKSYVSWCMKLLLERNGHSTLIYYQVIRGTRMW